MLEQARQRVAHNGWSGVALLEATAEDAPLQGKADAALFHFTPTCCATRRRSTTCWPTSTGCARGGQRAAVGAALAAAHHLFVLGAALLFGERWTGWRSPWTLLANRLDGFEVRLFLGGHLCGLRAGSVTSRAWPIHRFPAPLGCHLALALALSACASMALAPAAKPRLVV